jgi:STELLO glycosyltransferases
MNKYIIITTINPLTPEIEAFVNTGSWQVLIVGDKKSSLIRNAKNLDFYSIEKQYSTGFKIVNKLPYNHYSRKNIGYLLAVKANASVIYETDDDNRPLENWDWPSFHCSTKIYSGNRFVNIYKYFSTEHSWPRGFPLEYIMDQHTDCELVHSEDREIGVWQGQVAGEPDVDAIFRLSGMKIPVFNDNPPAYLKHGHYCPFNSQNTLWNPRAFPLMYLPVFVNSRFTDILRGYIAQRLMRDYNLHLGFVAPNVFQKRNQHNLMQDFRDEWDVYVNVPRIVDLLESTDTGHNMLQGLRNMYKALFINGIVLEGELEVVDLWCEDIINLGK